MRLTSPSSEALFQLARRVTNSCLVLSALFGITACGMNGFSPLSADQQKAVALAQQKAEAKLKCGTEGVINGFGTFQADDGTTSYKFGPCVDSKEAGLTSPLAGTPHDVAPGVDAADKAAKPDPASHDEAPQPGPSASPTPAPAVALTH